MSTAASDRPSCPACGKPIGAYEPVLQVAPEVGVRRTSWSEIAHAVRSPLEMLWHVECAESAGLEGG